MRAPGGGPLMDRELSDLHRGARDARRRMLEDPDPEPEPEEPDRFIVTSEVQHPNRGREETITVDSQPLTQADAIDFAVSLDSEEIVESVSVKPHTE